MEPAFLKWIESVKKTTGPVLARSQKSFRLQMKGLYTAAKVKPVDNGFRHSYASYFIAARNLENIGYATLAYNMGDSEDVARKHYVKDLTPEEGLEYFAL